MQKTEFQISGHLYRKSNSDSSWSNRFVTLSTDTGSMKFYAEKSGKKTMKNQINVRKSKFIPLDQEKAGKPFAFELNTQELTGKSDDAVMILAAMDQTQYDSWKEGIELCFTIGGEARRRKSSIIAGPAAMEMLMLNTPAAAQATQPVTQPAVQPVSSVSAAAEEEVPLPPKQFERPLPGIPLDSVPSMDEVEQESSKEKKIDIVKKMGGLQIPMVTPEMLETKKRISVSSNQKVPFSSMPTILSTESVEMGSPPLSIVPPPFDETGSIKSTSSSPPPTNTTLSEPHSLNHIDSLSTDLTPVSMPMKDDTNANANATETTPEGDGRKSVSLAETPISELTDGQQKELLERRGSRKSFKVPNNFKSLLNSNGLDAAVKEEKKPASKEPAAVAAAATSELASSSADGSTSSKPTTPSAKAKPKPPRDIKLTVRPTEPQRTGMLEKFDLAQKDEGEDAWVMIEVDLDIATGLVQTYSNIGGRRILRVKYSLKDLHVTPMDSVYYGKLFAFRFSRVKDSDDENDFAAVFAADDHETYSYWMVSFDDVRAHEEEEKKKLEEELKARLEAEAEERRRKEEEEQRLEAERIRILEERRREAEIVELARQQAEVMAKAKAAAAAASAASFVNSVSSPVSSSADEKPKPKRMSVKEKLAAQFAAKAAGLPVPTFDDDEDDAVQQPVSESKGIESMNKTSSMSFVGPVVHVTDANVDDMLKISSVASGESSYNGSSISFAHQPPSPTPAVSLTPMDPRMALIDKLEFRVNKTTYPADRLSRRVKIWYCSSGFSLSSVTEIQQFVTELKNTGDHTLEAFADEKFDKINDWANLLEVLRKYEQRLLIDMPPSNVEDDAVIKVDVEVLLPDEKKKLNFVINDKFSIDDLSQRVAEEFRFNELAVTARMPAILLKEASNPWMKSFSFLQEELTFAEDLVLYQEEVIEHMWESHSALKALIEQKDEVINQLYNQLSELQDKVRFMQTTTEFTTPSSLSTTNNMSASSSSVFQTSSALASKGMKTIQALADKEFNEADKDGDGRISREEWRQWIQDKHNLIQEHNQIKSALMNEIKTLRKALSPASEQVYSDLTKSEDVRKKQEEEIIQVHIERDTLKDELQHLQLKLREMEEEKEMIEYGWKEKYEALAFQKQQESGEKKDSDAEQLQQQYAGMNPYAYNYPQDQALGIQTAPDRSHHMAVSLLQGSHSTLLGAPSGGSFYAYQPDGGDNMDSGLDLMSLANMSDANLGANSFQGAYPPQQQHHQQQQNNSSGYYGNQYPPQQQQYDDQQWMQPYQHEANLGSNNNIHNSSTSLYGLPPPALNDNAYNYNNLGSNPYGNTPLTARSQSSQYGRPAEFNPTPSKAARPPTHPSTTPARYGSPRALPPAGPPAPPIAVDHNHPLRNALREEVKHKSNQSLLFAVPSPYAVVKSTGKAATRARPVIESSVLPGRSDVSPSMRESRSHTATSTPNRTGNSSEFVSGRAHSPNRFMQGTNSWKLKATGDKPAVAPGANSAIRTSGGWK